MTLVIKSPRGVKRVVPPPPPPHTHTHTHKPHGFACSQKGQKSTPMSLLRLDPNPRPNTDIPGPWESTSFMSSCTSPSPVVPLVLWSKVKLTPKIHDRHSHTRRQEAGGSSVVRAHGLEIERSRVRVLAGAAGECSSRRSTFCADSGLFRYSFDPPCYRSST